MTQVAILPGARICHDGHRGTVRFGPGPVQGAAGAWLGVEWDDASRGKHDGTKVSSTETDEILMLTILVQDGIRYFSCSSVDDCPLRW